MASTRNRDSADTSAPPIRVLYEDNHVIVVHKPAGMLMQADRSEAPCLLTVLKSWIKVRDARPGNVFVGLVHRLDLPVAGVALFARTSKAASRLSAQFRDRSIEKIYRAWVEGRPPQESGTLEHFLGADATFGVVVSDSPGPDLKRAQLRYRLLDSKSGVSCVEVELLTGRKHQIRAQLARVGCPIVGDSKYGARRSFEKGAIALECRTLAFNHPTRPAERITVNLPGELSWGGVFK